MRVVTRSRSIGECFNCGVWWKVGEEIATDSWHWFHDVCPKDRPVTAKKRRGPIPREDEDLGPSQSEEFCHQCFLIHPVGICDK